MPRLVSGSVAAAVLLLAANASWAQQREAAVLRGPMSERPLILVNDPNKGAART